MQYDVIISGGGIVGLLLACLLGQSGRHVAVIERQVPGNFDVTADFELRVSALSRASQQVLQQVGAWAGVVQRRLAAYRHMVVWDATGNGEIRFDAGELGEPELGHIVENAVVQLALLDVVAAYDRIDLLCPGQLQGFTLSDEQVSVRLNNGDAITASLLVAADGANSRVRELADIGWQREDYAQKGLVCVAKTQQPHQATAWQRFMPSGPLAFLPLPDQHYCSVVWSLAADDADVLLRLAESEFNHRLSRALDLRLGEVVATGPRAAFPLAGSHAEHYVQERIALIGDAAHTIHPLAGQGVNLGIADAAELAQQLQGVAADSLGRFKVLRRFERARKGENLLTLKAMAGFSLLFGNEQPLLQLTRNKGLNLMNRLPLLKGQLARRAMGI